MMDAHSLALRDSERGSPTGDAHCQRNTYVQRAVKVGKADTPLGWVGSTRALGMHARLPQIPTYHLLVRR